MKLNRLLAEAKLGSAADIDGGSEVCLVTENSESVVPGSIFVCINGKNYNGHLKAAEVAAKGAVLIVGEEDISVPRYLRVENARSAVSSLSRAFFGRPDRRLTLIGITGTNGKTTTAEYIRHILNRTGEKCGVIGTLGWDCGDGRVPSERTTPDSFTFFSELKRTADRGCRFCAAEVSSQALDQCRVDGAAFKLAVLTNIGHDHLDYHKTVREYADAKKKLFSLASAGLVNADDAYRDEFAACLNGRKCGFYSAGVNISDYYAKNIKSGKTGGSSYDLFDGAHLKRVAVSAPGKIGVYNSLCAASACLMLGADFDDTAEALCCLPGVDGRSEVMTSENGIRICVDFAHTPEALGAVISSLKEGASGRLITVFGCGGERDASKRPVMGRVAYAGSDCVILTSDNPRSEDPEKIITDISSGIHNRENLFREPDRRKAIALALSKAQRGDTVLIAGKGHETTQITADGTEHFNDAETVRSLVCVKQ